MADQRILWYRGISFVKDFLVKYLQAIFYANNKGNLLITDGTKKVEFSNLPFVGKRASWDARTQMPAVIIGKASGSLPAISFTKDLLTTDLTEGVSGGATGDYVTWEGVGSDFDLNYTLSARATTIEERDKLVDVTGIYLAHPDAKDYFNTHYLVLPEGPKVSGENDIKEPGIDHPIYGTDLSIRIISRWQENRGTNVWRIEDIVADATAYFTLNSNPGRTDLTED